MSNEPDPLDAEAGFEVLDDFERFSQKDDIYSRAFWDPEIRSEKTDRFFETYRTPLKVWKTVEGFTQRDYALRNASWHLPDFFADLKEHDAGDNVIMMLFTEFGRRVKDNGSGTDHGAGGHCFIVGEQVKGGLYGEYPSLDADKLDDGDLQFNTDFRSVYTTILEKWMGLDAKPIVGGEFEQLAFV